MKSRKSTIIGIFCGLACAFSVFLYTSTVQAEALAEREEILARYGGEQIEVCVATRDIAVGETVNTNNVATKTWVVDLLPENAVLTLDEVVGKKTSSGIAKGEVITVGRFEQESQDFDIPEGMSALSVPAKDVQAVGGSLVAGMKIDLYATGATSTNLLAKEVLVLATSVGESSGSSPGFSWVTLALKNESVEEIIAASQKMELYFVLPG